MTPTAHPAEDGARTPRWEWVLFGLALAVYLASRVAGLTRYPIFFFGDEAIQGNLVEQLLRNHFRDQTGTLLPPYFLNDRRWAVSLSVYIHLVPVWLFGKTIATIRATTVAVTLVGAAAAGLAPRVGRLSRFWWAAPLILAVEPLHFVHARLGFETIMMASFFFCFLWAYFLYRFRSPRFLPLALVFGAATFYAYTAGQGVMLLTGGLLFLSDLRYHLRQRWTLWVGALGLGLLLAIPYLRYRSLHPGVVREQLVVLDSYWVHAIPLAEKLRTFGSHYLQGLDPRYWFWPNPAELARHRMDDLGFFPLAFLPFVALGAGSCLWRWRSSAHRAVLFCLPGVPFAASIANIQILRLMAMIVPVTLLVLVALDELARWVRRLLPTPVAAGALFVGLCAATFALTRSALVHGATWFTDYGLYGQQWGAQQVFGKIREDLARSPSTRVLLSSTWANNPTEFLLFFLPPEERQRVRIADIYEFNVHRSPLTAEDLFVMTPAEYELARQDAKFRVADPEAVLAYPDGNPGFYFVRMVYSPDADAVFERERAERARLEETTITLKGEAVVLRHSQLDMGRIESLFDGTPQAMVRGKGVNPIVFEFKFPHPRPITGLTVDLGAMAQVNLVVLATPAGAREPRRFTVRFQNRPANRFEYTLPEGPMVIDRLRLEITDVEAELSYIEVWGLSLR